LSYYDSGDIEKKCFYKDLFINGNIKIEYEATNGYLDGILRKYS